jgi:hypothetical protein
VFTSLYDKLDLESADFNVFLRKEVSKFLLPLHSIRDTLICAALVFATQSAIENLLQSAEPVLGNLCD